MNQSEANVDVSFDGVSDEDLNLIWTECRNCFEVAARIADNDARDDAHTAWMAVIAEQGRRTQAWIEARTTEAYERT